jgi:hypothetical protein
MKIHKKESVLGARISKRETRDSGLLSAHSRERLCEEGRI